MANLTKRDATHAPIKRGLLDAGRPVKDVAHYPSFGCDLVTEHVDGFVLFLELKDGTKPPSARKLTKSEEELRRLFPRSFRVAGSLDEALRACGLTMEGPTPWMTMR